MDEKNPEEARPKPGYSHIPPELVAKIGDGHLTAYQLNSKISSLESVVSDLRIWRNVLTTIVAAIVALALTFVGGLGVEYAKIRWLTPISASPSSDDQQQTNRLSDWPSSPATASSN